MYPELNLFIDGDWRGSPETMPVVNPATEDVIAYLPVAQRGDLEDAIAAAERGFKTWRCTAPRDRANLIRRAAALMRARQEEIAHAITLEHGKPIAQARLEVIRGAEFSNGTQVKRCAPMDGSSRRGSAKNIWCTTTQSGLSPRSRPGTSR